MAPRIERDESGLPDGVWISAAAGEGLDLLAQAIAERLSRTVSRWRLRLPMSAGALRSKLYGQGVVVAERPSEEGYDLTVNLPVIDAERLAGGHAVLVEPETCEATGPYLKSTVPLAASRPRQFQG
jgi:GTPase